MSAGVPVEAVIVAGGKGTRLGLGTAKPLLRVAGRSLFMHNLDSLAACRGVERVLVYAECPLTVRRLELEAAGTDAFPVEIRLCHRSASTFAIARRAAAVLTRRFLFLYGHAPRSAAHLRRLLAVTAPRAGTATARSTRREPLALARRGFLEPPFLLHPADVASCAGETWRQFFDSRPVAIVPVDGPGEFNSYGEFLQYRRYVELRYRARGRAWHTAMAAPSPDRALATALGAPNPGH